MVKMKQKTRSPHSKSNASPKVANGWSVGREAIEFNEHSNHTKTLMPTNKAMNGTNGLNGHHPVATPHNQNPSSGGRTRSQSTPKSLCPTPTAATTKHLLQTKHVTPLPLPSVNTSTSCVTNARQTPHSYPKTSQLSALLSSAHQWSQSSLPSSDPLSESHVRFAGSRFTEAPNPSLLPKPPKHWMSANAINTMATNSSDAQHNTTDDNIIALKLLQISRDMKPIGANSIANNGVYYGHQSYVN